ncbi:MAG TPA: helix-turn-helix transcriptional regulator [Gemmatimonadales bacterium]
MSLSTTAEQQAFHSVKRVCYAGLDSVTLRSELARRVERVVPSDQHHFWTLDPETGLITHGIAKHPSPKLLDEFLGHYYPDDEATKTIDQARSGAVIKFSDIPVGLERTLHEVGLRHHMRALFFTPEAFWGSWCILRGGAAGFTGREGRFLERIAPHVSEGLKSAALLELSSREAESGEAAEPSMIVSPAPAFLVLGPRGEVVLRTGAASRYLDDLGAENADGGDPLPFAVLSVRGRLLRLRHPPDDAPAAARLRARGRSGTWYALNATLSEPDASGRSSTVISIEPAGRREVAPLLFRLYGLSPREREVLLWVLRGEPTKRIAWQLGLSVHTVQDYLDKACEKVGVRGRKALVAKLFQDGFAPELCA